MKSNTSMILYERRYLFILIGFDIDTPDDFGRTCLHAAAAGGYVNSIFISFMKSVLDYTLSIPRASGFLPEILRDRYQS